jgi:ATP-dependent Lon protease
MAAPKKNKSSPVTIPIRAYPVLPLRDIVVFPFMIVPLFVGRSKSIAALEKAAQDDGMVFLSFTKWAPWPRFCRC